MRFIISYLNAKRNDVHGDFEKRIEKARFWPSQGEYLHRSTLRTLARCVSGSDIPKDILDSGTFEGSVDAVMDDRAAMACGADVREAYIASAKRLGH